MSLSNRRCLVAMLLAMLSLEMNCWAQNSDTGFRRPTAIACTPAQWPDEARRYELEGTTVLQYDVDDQGHPSAIRVSRSSGWKVLDYAAVGAMRSCRFQPSTDPMVVRTDLKIPVEWTLGNNGELPPASARLIPDSCAPSPYFGAFVPFTGKVPPRDNGILVRFLLDEKGNTFGIKVEETDRAPINMATNFIRSCRFSPATKDGMSVHGNLTGWLIMK